MLKTKATYCGQRPRSLFPTNLWLILEPYLFFQLCAASGREGEVVPPRGATLQLLLVRSSSPGPCSLSYKLGRSFLCFKNPGFYCPKPLLLTWVHVFCGSTNGNYTNLSCPVIGNSHQENLEPPVSRSGSWLLNKVEGNPDVANGIWTRTCLAVIPAREWLGVRDHQFYFIKYFYHFWQYCYY